MSRAQRYLIAGLVLGIVIGFFLTMAAKVEARPAYASWYGPGLYGNNLGCSGYGTLQYGTMGIAHKTMACGTKVTITHRGRKVRVRVIDRGPYIAGREIDLTEATKNALGFSGHGYVDMKIGWTYTYLTSKVKVSKKRGLGQSREKL